MHLYSRLEFVHLFKLLPLLSSYMRFLSSHFKGASKRQAHTFHHGAHAPSLIIFKNQIGQRHEALGGFGSVSGSWRKRDSILKVWSYREFHFLFIESLSREEHVFLV